MGLICLIKRPLLASLLCALAMPGMLGAPDPGRALPEIIYNDDGLYVFQEQLLREDTLQRPFAQILPWIFNPVRDWNRPEGESRCVPLKKYQSVQDFLDIRLSALAETKVDCVSFFDNWIDYKSHPVLGESPLFHVADWGRRHGKQIFLSVRMNDDHHMHHNWNALDMSRRKFLVDNRDLLIDPLSDNEWQNVYLPWTTGQAALPALYRYETYGKLVNGVPSKAHDLRFDWHHQAVGEHYLAEILGKCEKYALDGVELDFWRTPKMFRVGAEEPEKITEFLRRLRHGLDEVGGKLGRQVFLIVRVPAPNEVPTPGLEPEKWLTEKLLDGIIIGQGNYLHHADLGRLPEIARRNGIKVYGPFERMPNNAYYENHGTPPMVRGSAAVNRFKGVDGLYFFNYYNREEYPVFNTLDGTAGHDTEYCNEVATVNQAGQKPVKKVVTGFAIPPHSGPISLVFDPVIINDPAGKRSYRITIATENIPAALLAIKINGVAVDGVGEAFYRNSDTRLDHVISSPTITGNLRQGRNVLEVTIRNNPFGRPLVFDYLAVNGFSEI